MAAPFQKNLPDFHKIEPLDGTNYKHWSQKLLLCFEQLEIYCVLTTEYADDTDASQNTDVDKSLSTPTTPKTLVIPLDEVARKKLEKHNKLARSYLLNNMSNSLFDLFVFFKSAKIIWTKLEAKYSHWEVVIVSDVDDKPIMEQVHIYENLCAEVLNVSMSLWAMLLPSEL